MKTEDLKAQGLTDEQIAYVMKENGKDITKLQKDVTALETERDKWKAQAETAEATLKGFDGVDVEKLNKEINDWKEKAEQAEKDYNAKLEERDFNDALRGALENVEFTSAAAKKAVEREIREAGLKMKNGKILGLNDLIDTIRENDATAFVDKDKQKAEANKASFTKPMSDVGSGNTMTKEKIMAIKDTTERQKAIAENPTLFV